MDKSIDHDRVADLYDIYVGADFDIEFWQHEAAASGGGILELMCGTGRIGLRLIEAGMTYTGVDYCRKLLSRFEEKLVSIGRRATLVHTDARSFDLPEAYDLIFIGFHSLSEVVDDRDKIRMLKRIRAHLRPGGRFVFSLHHPATRAGAFTGEKTEPQVFEFDDGCRRLEFAHRFLPPSPEGIVSGRQHYVIKDRTGQVLESRELDLRFHLIAKEEIDSLLAQTGFRVVRLWGDYDRSAFSPTSPYMIYRCVLPD